MKQKVLALVLCILTCLSFVACQQEEEIPEYVTTIGPQMEKELSSGQFYLEGDLYQFPITVGELRENGYYMGLYYENEDSFTLPPGGQSDSFMMAKDVDGEGNEIWCQVYNPTDEELPLNECQIGYIQMMRPSAMMFPGGLWSESDYEEVQAIYGEPRDFENNSDTIYTYWYDIEMEDGSKWEVKFRMKSWAIGEVSYTWEGMEE